MLQIKQLLLRTGVPINPKVLGADSLNSAMAALWLFSRPLKNPEFGTPMSMQHKKGSRYATNHCKLAL
jgi:hypothetical protein